MYPDDRPDLHDEPVWGVYEVETDDDSGEWEFTTVKYGVTLAEALDTSDEDYPETRVLG